MYKAGARYNIGECAWGLKLEGQAQKASLRSNRTTTRIRVSCATLMGGMSAVHAKQFLATPRYRTLNAGPKGAYLLQQGSAPELGFRV